jgi:hypothetical protein
VGRVGCMIDSVREGDTEIEREGGRGGERVRMIVRGRGEIEGNMGRDI